MSDVDNGNGGGGQGQPTFDETLTAEIDRLFDAADQVDGKGAGTGDGGGQARGADGRFSASDAGAGAKGGDGAAAGAANTDTDQPPDWLEEAVKPHWAAASPELRKFLSDRVGTTQKQLTEHGERLKGYDALEQILGPRRQALAAGFGSVEQAIKFLFDASDHAGRDLPGFVKQMAAQRGIDLPSLVALLNGGTAPAAGSSQGGGGGAASADPKVAALEAKIADLEKDAKARADAEAADVDRKAADAISTFMNAKSDKGEPLYPHFMTVRAAMGALMGVNPAMQLPEAYKIAVAADEKLQARIAEDAAKAQKAKEEAEAKEKANKARRAQGADLRTTSGSGAAQRGSFDDTLKAAIDKAFDEAA